MLPCTKVKYFTCEALVPIHVHYAFPILLSKSVKITKYKRGLLQGHCGKKMSYSSDIVRFSRLHRSAMSLGLKNDLMKFM